MNAFHFHQGNSPLLVSMPHVGLEIPDFIKNDMTDDALSLTDTDWHIDRLYNFLVDMDISVISAKYSRYVVDLNRGTDGQSLYPRQKVTGLCPLETFEEKPLYKKGKVPDINQRVETYWQPYHDKIRIELDRIKKRHGRAMLWDAHSIKSRVPMLFDGCLPDLNIGTGNGISAGHLLVEKLDRITSQSSYSSALNGRFKGGYITRHYGDPKNNIHAVQLEISQITYMDEEPNVRFNEAKANKLRPILIRLIETMIE
ncbi:MAG: N-formylglutamate deformylase [Alphaproteobacteria bacterium]|nr:N-formylglutamate deformylase [Alphaproteobacteria bacterium]HPF45275.1 N-formylglutamate deformylase [Emcibacteraceae bacterium]HRW28856.1 N-formylglutamate deformylase [Emcibacteraceae bacterium]